jgi:hypothetical protein
VSFSITDPLPTFPLELATKRATILSLVPAETMAFTELDGSCCDDPRPRVNERNGRMFCGSCKTYLDHRLTVPDPLSGQPAAEAGIVPADGDADQGAPQEGDLLGD